MSKRRGKIPKKVAKELERKSQKLKEERAEIAMKLYSACIYGGSINEIKKLVGIYDYTKEEILEAINTLETSRMSALEVMISEESIKFLKGLLKNKFV
jgi:gamma-glutamylcyclotransferase (GGCT)/AIG2-like uncharacterized protein YtfP